MRLDHVSYVTSHDQLADTVQRLGSRLGSTFVDGGVHPRFGTRNFTLALQNGQYIEVVCPLDHPASDASPFGKAVSKRAAEGGGIPEPAYLTVHHFHFHYSFMVKTIGDFLVKVLILFMLTHRTS
jgi:hypothetical protein